MIVSIPKTVRRLYFMTLLVAFSCLLYYALNWISGWISPVDHYDIPEGSAVRAFQDAPHTGDELNAGERLRLYYWYGE
ncbi:MULTISPECIES: DUF4227 family protein [Paenibacillus]|uniref:DUF4227 family protein n=1 Tax=Paenibacillus TaxID=44249 RepID=UPI001C8D58FF|nr:MULTISPECIES: DUF4227 family protein [Paenibacillus]MBY0010334.1 YqzK family protein [Paenibacillus typhae]MDF9840439.1 hypothetical protein [Paenibacillus sp. PastF-2]MDF9847021.1 hypothetical protein [Paenibacillus sp. PastM-2]MDF9853593.1 hypothetical protein [Paenibacillus sp. PastF-1]MDH6478921.1 hypothetical protein [Paenibacillus sp. PastH-2]